jgi:hypothetical protein
MWSSFYFCMSTFISCDELLSGKLHMLGVNLGNFLKNLATNMSVLRQNVVSHNVYVT